MLRAAFEAATVSHRVISLCGFDFLCVVHRLFWLAICMESGPFSSLCNSSVAVEVRAAGHHGKHLWQPVEEPDRQEGDEDPHGGAGRGRENHHPLQAEAGGDRHHHPHNRCVGGKDSLLFAETPVTEFVQLL